MCHISHEYIYFCLFYKLPRIEMLCRRRVTMIYSFLVFFFNLLFLNKVSLLKLSTNLTEQSKSTCLDFE